jgi:hypothetical protein
VVGGLSPVAFAATRARVRRCSSSTRRCVSGLVPQTISAAAGAVNTETINAKSETVFMTRRNLRSAGRSGVTGLTS